MPTLQTASWHSVSNFFREMSGKNRRKHRKVGNSVETQMCLFSAPWMLCPILRNHNSNLAFSESKVDREFVFKACLNVIKEWADWCSFGELLVKFTKGSGRFSISLSGKMFRNQDTLWGSFYMGISQNSQSHRGAGSPYCQTSWELGTSSPVSSCWPGRQLAQQCEICDVPGTGLPKEMVLTAFTEYCHKSRQI